MSLKTFKVLLVLSVQAHSLQAARQLLPKKRDHHVGVSFIPQFLFFVLLIGCFFQISQLSEMDRKKAEVRKRMEEQSMKKKKKGFMTPERKKKLRLLLRKKAAEELKKEQERKSAERRKVIDQRCGKPQSTDGMSESKQAKNLKTIFSISQKSLIQPKIHILKSSFLTKFTSSTPHFFTKITISKSYFSQKFTFS